MVDLRPMTPIADSAAWMAEFHAMSTADLKQALADSLALTANNLLRSACMVHVLEDRGEDLSALKIGLLHYLRKIACGQLLPEIVVRFAGKPSLIKVIGNLPLSDQRHFAQGGLVRLIVYAPHGGRTDRMADPLNLTPSQVRQVFAADHLRQEQEQHLVLDDQTRRVRQTAPESIGAMRLDVERGGVIHKGEFISVADMRRAIRCLRQFGKT